MRAEPEIFEFDGVEWERWNYGEGDDWFQRRCDGGCDRGLLLAPARFCPRCDGSGYFVRHSDPRVIVGPSKEETR